MSKPLPSFRTETEGHTNQIQKKIQKHVIMLVSVKPMVAIGTEENEIKHKKQIQIQFQHTNECKNKNSAGECQTNDLNWDREPAG